MASFALRASVAFAFAIAGAANLWGASGSARMFDAIGAGPSLRYLAGFVELAGAAMLLLPGFIGIGAFLLAATMVCALLLSLFMFGDSPIETLLLLAAAGAILWHRRRELLILYRRHLGLRRLGGIAAANSYTAFFWFGFGTCLAWTAMTVVVALGMFR